MGGRWQPHLHLHVLEGASPSSKVLYILFTWSVSISIYRYRIRDSSTHGSGEGRGVEPVSSALEISSRLTLLPSDQSCPNLCALRSTAFPLGCPQAGLCSF